MAKRLSDTAAITSRKPDGCRVTNYEVRPVDNGFVVKKGTYDGNGGYSSSERFCKSEPCVQEPENDGGTRKSQLNEATRYLRGK